MALLPTHFGQALTIDLTAPAVEGIGNGKAVLAVDCLLGCFFLGHGIELVGGGVGCEMVG